MKVRNGFVSNSSSSSFIVVLDEKPRDIEHFKQMMFDFDRTAIVCLRFDSVMKIDDVVKDIYDPEQKPINDKDLVEFLSGATCDDFPGCPDMDDKRFESDKEYDWGGKMIDWKAYQKAHEEWAEQKAKEIRQEYNGKCLFYYNWGDIHEGSSLIEETLQYEYDTYIKAPVIRVNGH